MSVVSPNTLIGGRQISVGTLAPTLALKVEVVIARVCGEALFKAFTTAKNQDEMQAAAGAAIALMTSRLDADELLQTMEIVMQCVRIDGAPVASIDASFVGRNRDLWQVFIYALRVNFADFFPDDLLRSIASQAKGLSPSNPPTSTGTSGVR
jgi:hypothetical protein